MAYIGNTASTRFVANRAASVYSGDGSTVAFTLEEAVGSDEDILVSVDGVVQEPSVAYAVSSGTTLTFSAAPSSNSGNNIFVYYLSLAKGSVVHPATSALSATTGTFSSNATVAGTLGVTGAATFTAQGQSPRVNVLAQVTGYTSGTVLTAAQSGAIVTFPAMNGAATLSLPACATCLGATYTFVMLGTAGNDVDIITNGSEKIIGCVPKGDGDNVGIADANDSAGFDANAVVGSSFKITCISTTAALAFLLHDVIDGLAANTGGINLK